MIAGILVIENNFFANAGRENGNDYGYDKVADI